MLSFRSSRSLLQPWTPLIQTYVIIFFVLCEIHEWQIIFLWINLLKPGSSELANQKSVLLIPAHLVTKCLFTKHNCPDLVETVSSLQVLSASLQLLHRHFLSISFVLELSMTENKDFSDLLVFAPGSRKCNNQLASCFIIIGICHTPMNEQKGWWNSRDWSRRRIVTEVGVLILQSKQEFKFLLKLMGLVYHERLFIHVSGTKTVQWKMDMTLNRDIFTCVLELEWGFDLMSLDFRKVG